MLRIHRRGIRQGFKHFKVLLVFSRNRRLKRRHFHFYLIVKQLLARNAVFGSRLNAVCLYLRGLNHIGKLFFKLLLALVCLNVKRGGKLLFPCGYNFYVRLRVVNYLGAFLLCLVHHLVGKLLRV